MLSKILTNTASTRPRYKCADHGVAVSFRVLGCEKPWIAEDNISHVIFIQNSHIMKKLILIAMLALASCTTAHYAIGMSESEFLRMNKSASAETQSVSYSVYRLHYHTGRGEGTQFFYFQDGVLVKVDKGVRKPDIIIDKTVHNE